MKRSVAVSRDPRTMPIEEKLRLLSDAEKAYLRGYLDRAALERRRLSGRGEARRPRGKAGGA